MACKHGGGGVERIEHDFKVKKECSGADCFEVENFRLLEVVL